MSEAKGRLVLRRYRFVLWQILRTHSASDHMDQKSLSPDVREKSSFSLLLDIFESVFLQKSVNFTRQKATSRKIETTRSSRK